MRATKILSKSEFKLCYILWSDVLAPEIIQTLSLRNLENVSRQILNILPNIDLNLFLFIGSMKRNFEALEQIIKFWSFEQELNNLIDE